ncbi:hypothetical protein Val02_64390 [Virgisporangium aliadipatigenens]|uniref:WXG100 family type VII secretion target n=1 Tax=Virgisporangium aliadipatigenens TaxID=741659 RepID=A0A8J3YTN3_9ACTN|nr:WXG100 family type VII secretion target [Virgisporangium aliadipatigenens]GIJ49553.1 hypothetical protein Val02_64390 [Virgisporangium aliadipatigenens]
MDGSGFKLTPDIVSTGAAACDTTAQNVAEQLGQLKAYVQGVQEKYHGVASETFGVLMTDFDIYAGMLNLALSGIGSGLRGNYINYTMAEESAIKNLVGIDGDIPGIKIDEIRPPVPPANL